MPTGYYQKTKKTSKKRLLKGIKIFLKKIETKKVIVSIVVNTIKIFLKMKNKSWRSIEKIII